MQGTPFGRYRLIELLGRGGMGEVWRACDTATNDRTVAIKLLPPQLAADATFVARFRREADAVAGLNNPHIIPIHTYGEIEGRLFVDMRLVEGRDLQRVLAGGPLEPGRAVYIVEQVATALHAAHKIGLVHRDVKPSNILLDEDDFAYLIDFGLARGADETGLTGSGSVIGSWHYMSPERLQAGQVDARADVYALACVLYECLTGATPYPGNNTEQQIAAHLMGPPPRPSNTDPRVPAAFDAVIATGMAKDPGLRYASAVELARAARDAITTAGAPPGEPAVGDDAALPRPAGWPVLIAAIVVIVIAVGAVFITPQLLQPNPPTPQTPTAQPAPPPPPGMVSSASAPSADVPGLAPFVGVWQGHRSRVVIDSTGTGHITSQGCIGCPVNTLDFTLTSVLHGFASGSVTASSDGNTRVGAPVTATLAAVLPGQLLQMTIGRGLEPPFCNAAAEAANQCGA